MAVAGVGHQFQFVQSENVSKDGNRFRKALDPAFKMMQGLSCDQFKNLVKGFLFVSLFQSAEAVDDSTRNIVGGVGAGIVFLMVAILLCYVCRYEHQQKVRNPNYPISV